MENFVNVILLIFIPLTLFCCDSENKPVRFVTNDSIEIISTPYSKKGEFGETTIRNLKTGNLNSKLGIYFNPESKFSADGVWIIQIGTFWINFYENGIFKKQYSRDDLISEDLGFEKLIRFPNGDEHYYSATACNWIIESFVIDQIFYVLLANGELGVIEFKTIKSNKGRQIRSIKFKEYQSLKLKAESLKIEINEDFYPPFFDEFVLNDSVFFERIKEEMRNAPNYPNYLSFVLFFENCVPTIHEYIEETQISIYPRGDIFFDPNNLLYLKLLKVVQTSSFVNCQKSDYKFKWAFSFTLKIK